MIVPPDHGKFNIDWGVPGILPGAIHHLASDISTGREKARASIARQLLRPALDRANEARARARAGSPIRRPSAALSLEVYTRVVAGATTGLGEWMARLVRGPE